MREFELIEQYFNKKLVTRPDVLLGIGDDAALVTRSNTQALAITTDTLVENIHFLQNTDPYDIGYKSLAVNLSDLAAMGAQPAWVTLALTLPKAHEQWLKRFCEGFFDLANRFNIQLIGGDTTHGPLSITITALGFTPLQQSLQRKNAKVGDLIYVSGTLGDAGLALQFLQGKIKVNANYQPSILAKLNRPEPRLEIGQKLLGIGNAAIDISDGFAADLSHILNASEVGAKVYLETLPLSNAVKQSLSPLQALQLALSAGDDYELCVTIPPHRQAQLEKVLSSCTISFSCVGEIIHGTNLELYQNGKLYHEETLGYQHF